MKTISAILLSAGKGTRAAGFKPLLTWKGETYISNVYRGLAETKAFREILVVTGHRAEELVPELSRLGARSVFNADYPNGMHSSIRAGLASLEPGWDGALIALLDQPHLTSEDYLWVADIFRSSDPECSLVRPIYHGTPGNPAVIGRVHLEEVLREPGADHGCAYLFKRHPARAVEVEMPSESCLMDFDSAPGAISGDLTRRS